MGNGKHIHTQFIFVSSRSVIHSSYVVCLSVKYSSYTGCVNITHKCLYVDFPMSYAISSIDFTQNIFVDEHEHEHNFYHCTK